MKLSPEKTPSLFDLSRASSYALASMNRVGPYFALALVGWSSVALAQFDGLGLDLSQETTEPATPAPEKPKRTKKSTEGEVPAKTELAISLASEVQGGKVFVDGVEVGTLPFTPVEVKRGARTVVIKRAGYKEFSRRVQIVSGQQNVVSVTLEATSGVLSVTATPEGAEVLLDGNSLGSAPLAEIEVAPGSHEVQVKKEGFVAQTFQIDSKAGEEQALSAELRISLEDRPEQAQLDVADQDPDLFAGQVEDAGPDRPWFKKWYVWTGIGVVAAAAAVGIVAWSSHSGGGKPAPPMDTNSVCSGACDLTLNGVWAQPGR